MLQDTAFTTWMISQGYPPKTPRVYLRDIEQAEVRIGTLLEPVSVANTSLFLHRISNEGPARTQHQMDNDRSAVNCYHEFCTGLPLPDYNRRGPRPATP